MSFCSGSSTSSIAGRGSPRIVGGHFVDLVEQDDRIDVPACFMALMTRPGIAPM